MAKNGYGVPSMKESGGLPDGRTVDIGGGQKMYNGYGKCSDNIKLPDPVKDLPVNSDSNKSLSG